MKAKLYSPYQTKKMTDKEMRKAYSQLRSIANKRLGRLQAQGLNMTARTGYRFPTIQQIAESSKSTLESELVDVSKFLRDQLHSTVKSEKKFISDFQEMMTAKGYGSLVGSVDDVYNTIDFLEDMRKKYSDKIYSSNDALDALQEVERLNMPVERLKENLELFTEHLDQLKKVRPSKGGAEFSSRRFNNLMDKWTK